MSRLSLLVLAVSVALLASGCGKSSGGGGGIDPADTMAIASLREELRLAGIQPLPDPPLVSDALFRLGQALFFDKLLSGNEDVSCATCHLPQFFTGDGRTLADGVHGIGLGPNRGGGVILPRNTPPLFAVHAKKRLFWDGRVQGVGSSVIVPPPASLSSDLLAIFSPGLEVLAGQAMLPPLSREEMRGQPGENPLANLGDDLTWYQWSGLTERLLELPGYRDMLREAYSIRAQLPFEFTFAHAANAIAAFEARAFAGTDSPFERFVRGDDRALTREQVKGGLAFFFAGCAGCHSGPLFTDEEFHNIGLPQLGPGVGVVVGVIPGSDIGRENATGEVEDRYRFRTPSLLDVALTAPYGHAGQFARLRDMVAHYLDPETSNLAYDIQANVSDPELVTTLVHNSRAVFATLDPRLSMRNDFDVDLVVAFLESLSAESALKLSEIVPASVPSGLPIF